MHEIILTTVISSICTLIGVIITVISGNKKTEWRIEQLEKKVEKHNNVIERVYKLEEDINYLGGRDK